MSKYNVGLKTLLQEGLSGPLFHGDSLVRNSDRLLAKLIFLEKIKNKKTVTRYKRMYILQQTADMAVNPIMVYGW